MPRTPHMTPRDGFPLPPPERRAGPCREFSLPLVGRDAGRGYGQEECARTGACIVIPDPPSRPSPTRGEGEQGRAPALGSCPGLSRASTRRCHLPRRRVSLWTTGTSPVVSRREGRDDATHTGAGPGTAPERGPSRAPTLGSCPGLTRASMRRCHLPHRRVPLWTTGSSPVVSRREGGNGATYTGAGLGTMPERGQGRAPTPGSCPGLTRASMQRCHMPRRRVPLWTAGTSPAVSPREQRRYRNASGPGAVVSRRESRDGATHTGSCPDLIRASMRRCHLPRHVIPTRPPRAAAAPQTRD